MITNTEMLRATHNEDLIEGWRMFKNETPPENIPLFVSNGADLIAAVYIIDEFGWHWEIPALLTDNDLSDAGNYEYGGNLEFAFWTYQPELPKT